MLIEKWHFRIYDPWLLTKEFFEDILEIIENLLPRNTYFISSLTFMCGLFWCSSNPLLLKISWIILSWVFLDFFYWIWYVFPL
jgi:hypothetical protein